MFIVKEIRKARDALIAMRQGRRTVGLVPTMGALHDGHMSLVRIAKQQCDAVALTIFVNPTQFAPQEDYQSYPRTLESDLAQCIAAGVDMVFIPSAEMMYPAPPLTTIHVSRLADGLCGPFRPGHFDGVATVVSKLFHILPADAAFFGEKDYQQLSVIRRMVADLNVPIRIVGCPTIREPDGLAMSSRNVYLSPAERRQAVCLSRALFKAASLALEGLRDADALKGVVRKEILSAGPADIEYIEMVDADSLAPLARADCPARICLAVRIGKCRLIDNVSVDGGSPQG